MNEEKVVEFANTIYQNAKVGMQSIHDIEDKISNRELLKELRSEYLEYEKISNKVEDYAKEHNLEIKDNNFFEKAKLWTSIKMSTMTDNSTRKIAQLLLIDTVMGLSQCYKDKFDYKQVDEKLYNTL